MSSVNITINGKQYRVACEPGQEQRVTALAVDFDQRIAGMRARFGEVGDARLTVMAAMMIGDELLDANMRIAKLEADLNALHTARAGASDRTNRTEAAVVTALDAAADRIERMTLALSRLAAPWRAPGLCLDSRVPSGKAHADCVAPVVSRFSVRDRFSRPLCAD